MIKLIAAVLLLSISYSLLSLGVKHSVLGYKWEGYKERSAGMSAVMISILSIAVAAFLLLR